MVVKPDKVEVRRHYYDGVLSHDSGFEQSRNSLLSQLSADDAGRSQRTFFVNQVSRCSTSSTAPSGPFAPSKSTRSKICLTPERTCPSTPAKSVFSNLIFPCTLKHCLWKTSRASGVSYRDSIRVWRRNFALHVNTFQEPRQADSLVVEVPRLDS